MQKVRGHGLTEGEPAGDRCQMSVKTKPHSRQRALQGNTLHCQLTTDICGLAFGEPAPTACRHSVSGSLSLPSSGCFSPFPHGTGSLSVTEEYLGLEGGPPKFRQGFTCPALLEDPKTIYPYGAITRSGLPFQTVPVCIPGPLAWSPFARHY